MPVILKSKLPKVNYFAILIVWIILLSLLYGALSVIRHSHFQSGGFDLGLYDQSVWQYSRFLLPYNTIKERFILGDHLALTLPLISPLYRIWSDVRILLIFQAVFIAVSAAAVYKIAENRKFSGFESLVLAFIFSLFYGIQYAVFFDFHPVVLGVGLLAWFVYFLETGRIKLSLITAILVVLTQENMGIALAGLGIIYLFKRKYRKSALVMIIGGITVSLIASKIISLLSPVGFQYRPEISLNPLTNITGLFDSQEKRQVWFYSFAWFSFLPLLSPGALLAVTMDLAQYFVTGKEFARMWSPFMHHRAILAPFLVLGVMDVLDFLRVRKVKISFVALLLLFSALFQQYIFHNPLNKLSKKEFTRQELWMENLHRLIPAVPDKAGVAAQQNLVPHLSQRQYIYMLWPRIHTFSGQPCGKSECWWLDFSGNPEYMVVDARQDQWLTQTLETNEHWQAAIAAMENSGFIIREKSVGDARLYRVDYARKPI